MKKIFLFLGILLTLSACGNNYEGDFSYEVESFEFTNQNGEVFNSEQLQDKFWVADMIFTNCETVCPPMTANMAKLQEKIKEEGLDVELVSFSVDPDNDSPEILKEYAEVRGGEFDNWNLLTGYEFQEIKEFAVKSFKAPVEKTADSDQMIHVVSFYLVSPEGNAILRYDGSDSDQMDQIIADIKKMM
ncbi:SCO family protein [Aquibacillus rhizosphaerae]|uniref:SCO family protein n=1 Tax=Aquibacillus rhizosphaerae TaxID=3051431 RepID=A0ABT7L8I0_9BACI|nr:SCO family protein [Aquibacillus sp. LR5S19]MDL4842159.1 SCO family protein [Aquibacillus sp. LR5S19]